MIPLDRNIVVFKVFVDFCVSSFFLSLIFLKQVVVFLFQYVQSLSCIHNDSLKLQKIKWKLF